MHLRSRTARLPIAALGRLAVAALVATSLLAPASVSANNFAGTLRVASTSVASGPPGECAGLRLAPGEVAWRFRQPNGSQPTPNTLTAMFTSAGTKTAVDVGTGNWEWTIITPGEDTLTAASSSVKQQRRPHPPLGLPRPCGTADPDPDADADVDMSARYLEAR